jgi:hypothetical protein
MGGLTRFVGYNEYACNAMVEIKIEESGVFAPAKRGTLKRLSLIKTLRKEECEHFRTTEK